MNSIRVIPKGLLGVEILLQKEMQLEVWLLKIRRYKLAVLRIFFIWYVHALYDLVNEALEY